MMFSVMKNPFFLLKEAKSFSVPNYLRWEIIF